MVLWHKRALTISTWVLCAQWRGSSVLIYLYCEKRVYLAEGGEPIFLIQPPPAVMKNTGGNKNIKLKLDILYFYYNFNNMSKLKSVSKAITWRGSNKVVQATTYFDCWIKLNKAGCFDGFLASTNIIGSDIFSFNGNGLLWAGSFIISWK